MMSSRVMITGASGMVGSHLAAEILLNSDYRVVLPLRSRERMDTMWGKLKSYGVLDIETIDPERVEIVECSLSDPYAIREVMRDIDIVFHCAASVSLSKSGGDIVASNVEITTNIVDRALEAKVNRFVHISSIASLGASTPAHPTIDETMDMDPSDQHSDYSISKFLSENQVKRGAEFGLKTVVVNPAIILGEGEWSGEGSSAILATLSLGFPAAPNGVTGYVDVRDVARAMRLLAVEDSAIGERFILCSESITFKRLAELAATSAGRMVPFITVGKFAVTSMRLVTELWARVTGTTNRLSSTIARNLLSKNYYDGDKISRHCNFSYTPVEQSVDRIVKLYLKSRRR